MALRHVHAFTHSTLVSIARVLTHWSLLHQTTFFHVVVAVLFYWPSRSPHVGNGEGRDSHLGALERIHLHVLVQAAGSARVVELGLLLARVRQVVYASSRNKGIWSFLLCRLRVRSLLLRGLTMLLDLIFFIHNNFDLKLRHGIVSRILS